MSAYRLLLLLLFLLSLSGCNTGYREINDEAIVVGFGIQKEKDGVKITIQVLNPAEIASSITTNRPEIITYSVPLKSSESFEEKMSEVLPKKLLLTHSLFYIIDKELLMDGIYNDLDYAIRSNLFNTRVKVIVSEKQKPEDLLKVLTQFDRNPMKQLSQVLDFSSLNYATSYDSRLDQTLIDILSPGIEPAIQVIKVKGKEKQSETMEDLSSASPLNTFITDGLAILDGDAYKFTLDNSEIPWFLLLKKKQTRFQIRYVDKKNRGIRTHLFASEQSIKRIIRSEPLSVHYNIHIIGTLQELQIPMDINKKTVAYIDKKMEQLILKKIKTTVHTFQKEKVDAFGIGQELYRHHPKEWAKLYEKNWNEKFANIPFTYEVHVDVKTFGRVIEHFDKNEFEVSGD
ncbi:MAG: Ger(x)C family spore germination protein [Bacilli bacterium]